jgi:hypothetical protein
LQHATAAENKSRLESQAIEVVARKTPTTTSKEQKKWKSSANGGKLVPSQIATHFQLQVPQQQKPKSRLERLPSK